jgi:hypothetical protein
VNLKTRTSQSINSELKDFSLHPFQECNANVASVAFKVDAGGDIKIADDDPTSTPGQIPVLSTVYDTATVTGVSGLSPTGTVTFDLYMSADCTGPLVDTETVALVPGDPATAQSKDIEIAVAGSYGFIATYSGDSNYPSASSGCEDFLVNTLNSSVTTDVVLSSDDSSVLNGAVELGTSVKDTARVLGNGTVIPTGDVTFIRYADATCSGTIQAMEDVTLDTTGEAESSPYVTGSDTSGSAQFACWHVIYGGDAVYSPSASTVGEPICAFEFDPDIL